MIKKFNEYNENYVHPPVPTKHWADDIENAINVALKEGKDREDILDHIKMYLKDTTGL